MPKAIKTPEGNYEYNCQCGQDMILMVAKNDPAPEKLIKCFACIRKDWLEYEKIEEIKWQKSHSTAKNAAKKS